MMTTIPQTLDKARPMEAIAHLGHTRATHGQLDQEVGVRWTARRFSETLQQDALLRGQSDEDSWIERVLR